MSTAGDEFGKKVAWDELAFLFREFVHAVVIDNRFLELVRIALEERKAAEKRFWRPKEKREKTIMNIWMKAKGGTLAATKNEVNAVYYLGDVFDKWRRDCEKMEG